ncbi:FlgO family outer membrane protein [Diaphorobacter nitroreducens]|uniref:FlgO family outer membrane protein n=1 Tax=Diaphorobacter nitroreducens TaxID=164759 RepID=UPI00289CBADE|nr:FlgO family outer membrane protein [Diaphorobacter nitroreducens]
MTQRIGIQRRVLLAAVLTASALALPGCARYYYGAAVSSDPVDLMASNHGAADALLLQVPLDPDTPVLVATVVQLDRLDESSRLGRLVAEQLAGRLAQRGLRVTELRMRETLAMRPGQGELLLSRHAQEVARAQAAQAVLVGTYAVAPQAVYVSLKLVGAGNAVLAAHDYALPMDANVRGLLAGR